MVSAIQQHEFNVDNFKSLYWLITVLLLYYVFFFFFLWGMWDLRSPTRDCAWSPCIGRWSLNHWATREVPIYHFKRSSLGRIPFVSEDSADLRHTGVTWKNSSSARTRVRVSSATDEVKCLKRCQAHNRCSICRLNRRQWVDRQVLQKTYYLCSISLAGQSLLFEWLGHYIK